MRVLTGLVCGLIILGLMGSGAQGATNSNKRKRYVRPQDDQQRRDDEPRRTRTSRPKPKSNPVTRAPDPNRQKLAAYEADVRAAQTELNGVRSRLLNSMQDSSDEWKTINEEYKAAKTAHDELVNPILKSLHESSAYVQVVADKKQAEEKLSALRANPTARRESMSDAAAQLKRIEHELEVLENRALSRAEVEAAQKRLAEAEARLNALRNEFDQAVQADEGYQDAKAKLEEARQELADAREQLRQPTNKPRPNTQTRARR